MLSGEAVAGMPSVSLSRLASFRLMSISFFVAVFLVAAIVVRWVWNRLAADFSRLPRLTYQKACLLLGGWGMAFILVLTMISGARELMTPGAWAVDGVTYRLKPRRDLDRSEEANANEVSADRSDGEALSAQDRLLSLRQAKLRALGRALDQFATENGRYPELLKDLALSPEMLLVHGLAKTPYRYVASGAKPQRLHPVLHEPPMFGETCWLYLAGGVTMLVTVEELPPLLSGETSLVLRPLDPLGDIDERNGTP